MECTFEIVDDFGFVCILQDTQEIHQLKRFVVAAIPLVALTEVGIEFSVNLAECYAQPDFIAWVDVHQLAP